MKHLIFLLLTIHLAITCFSQQQEIVHERSSISFKIKNFGLTVEGKFSKFSGAIIFDPQSQRNKFSIRIESTSVDTGIALRDKHLKKKEFLNVEDFPAITFLSTAVDNHTGRWTVNGVVTVKNVSREISFPFAVLEEDGGFKLSGTFKIDRRDFNVGGSSMSMGDEVTVSVDMYVHEGKK
jgi:polyisoprenoid-binding protein YceI